MTKGVKEEEEKEEGKKRKKEGGKGRSPKRSKKEEANEKLRKVLMFKDTPIGGYFFITGEQRDTCLGPTFSTFIFRPKDSQNRISETAKQIQEMEKK